MRLSSRDEVQEPYGVATVKQEFACSEAAFDGSKLPELIDERVGHDSYHMAMQKNGARRSEIIATRIRTMRLHASIALLLALPASALAQHAHQPGQEHSSPYAGQESRETKSLSEEDIATLRTGGGWELAKPAELNGIPGPAHLLEMKDEIELTPEQVEVIEAAYQGMRTAAIAEGQRYISGERRLDESFRRGVVTEKSLRTALEDIERSRSALRYIHLSTHLKMPAILTEEQIRRYNTLRGYQLD